MKRQFLLFIFMMAVAIPSLAQMVTGKIVDSFDDEPMEGAQVWYKDRPAAKVLADVNGSYKIRFRPGTLVFHFFGYKDVEVWTSTTWRPDYTCWQYRLWCTLLWDFC